MVSTINSYFRTTDPRMSKQGFIDILNKANSPFTKDAEVIYEMLDANGFDPATALGVAHREHQYGTDPNSVFVRSETKSWANARSIRDPSLKNKAKLITDPVRNSQYVQYETYLDSVQDFIYRIADPTYAYANATTIQEVISVLAPASDGNNPTSYAQGIVNDINEWQTKYPYQTTPPPTQDSIPTAQDIGFPVQVVWAQDRGPERKLEDIRWFILHSTEGFWPSDRDYLAAATPPVASAHAVIAPDGTVAFEVPLTITAWTAGNDYYSRHAVQVEISGFAAKGFTEQQYRSTANFCVWCMRQGITNVPTEYIGKDPTSTRNGFIGHQDVPNPNKDSPDACGPWGGHSCHGDPGAKFDWTKFIHYVQEAQDSHPTPPTPVNQKYFAETGHFISQGFYGYYMQRGEDVGRELFGLPLSEEFKDPKTGITIQYFERARFEFQPTLTSNPYGTVLGLLGSELTTRTKLRDKFPAAFLSKPAPTPTP